MITQRKVLMGTRRYAQVREEGLVRAEPFGHKPRRERERETERGRVGHWRARDGGVLSYSACAMQQMQTAVHTNCMLQSGRRTATRPSQVTVPTHCPLLTVCCVAMMFVVSSCYGWCLRIVFFVPCQHDQLVLSAFLSVVCILLSSLSSRFVLYFPPLPCVSFPIPYCCSHYHSLPHLSISMLDLPSRNSD